MASADDSQDPSKLPRLYFVRDQFADYWTKLVARVRQNDDCDRVYTGALPNPVIQLQKLCSATIAGYHVPLVTDFDLQNNPLDAVDRFQAAILVAARVSDPPTNPPLGSAEGATTRDASNNIIPDPTAGVWKNFTAA